MPWLLFLVAPLAAEPPADIWIKNPGPGIETPLPEKKEPIPSSPSTASSARQQTLPDMLQEAPAPIPKTDLPKKQAIPPDLEEESPSTPSEKRTLEAKKEDPPPPPSHPAFHEPPVYPKWPSNRLYRYHYGLSRNVSEKTIGERNEAAHKNLYGLYQKAYLQSPETFHHACRLDPSSVVCKHLKEAGAKIPEFDRDRPPQGQNDAPAIP